MRVRDDPGAAIRYQCAVAIDTGARARGYYERIEPVAEIWGKLDLQIDGRINDFVPRSGFTGFHRIEEVLWASAATGLPRISGGLGAADLVATQLVRHVHQLQALAAQAQYTPLELTAGATDLLHEVEASKIIGEEECYSHLDLLDLVANVAGTNMIVRLLRPALRAYDPTLLKTIDQRAEVVADGLQRYRAQPGYAGSGFLRYTALTTAQRRTLADQIEALTESVALITAAISH